ncbi:hypothetical protein [Leisingera sp. S232]|uniref:hypothetical protein n=1 Tax=Leisingera sp. S232 TaxID=3415132 RepID=UPI003C7A1F6B
MQHQEFTQYISDLDDGSEFRATIARSYKNHLGVEEIILLPQCYWDIAAWLEEQGAIDFNEWVRHCSENPHEDWSLSHQLMYWLWYDLSIRHRDDHPMPPNMIPEGHLLANIPANEA